MNINDVISDVVETMEILDQSKMEIQVLNKGRQIEYSQLDNPVMVFLSLQNKYDFENVIVSKGVNGPKLVAHVKPA